MTLPPVRYICLAVILGALWAPHWIPVLRGQLDPPIVFVAALGVATVVALARASSANRRSTGGQATSDTRCEARPTAGPLPGRGEGADNGGGARVRRS
jgi:hypothetical protein